MSVIRHWLAYTKWGSVPRVVESEGLVERYEQSSDWTLEGPFVPADQLQGAVEALRSIAFSDHDHPEPSASDLRTRAFVAWKAATHQGGQS